MKLKVFHENEWREYPARVFTEQGWQSFTPRNISGIKRIWPRSVTPPPAGTTYEWAGEPHASESIKRVDGVEVTRSAQVVAPQLLEDGQTLRLDFPIPEDANTYQWRAEFRSTEIREGYDEAGFHATFSGPETTKGLAARFPADGEWQEYGRTYTIDPEATTGYIRFIGGSLTPPWYEIRRLQVAFYTDAGWPDYFDGDTESDRAHDLWYNTNGVPHVWVNGQGWTEL